MNGISATPPGPHPGDDTPGVEAELTRRLHDLGTTTVGDVDRTWEQIQARVAGRAGGDAGPRWGPGWGGRRLLLAAAAVTVLAAGIAAVSRAGQGGGDGGVRIGNQTTTSDRLPVPDPPRHPSRTTSTTTAPAGSSPGTAPPAGQTSGQAPAGEEQPGGAGGPEVPASGDPAGATGGDAARAIAEIRILLPEYGAEIVHADATLYFRRDDDVGSTRPGPDAHGHVDSATWGTVSGRRCLTSGGGEYAFPDAPTRAFSYGLLGDDIEVVEIVMADGRRQRGHRWHHVEPDIRMWYTQRPLGQVDRIEGLDAAGAVVATIADPDGDHGSAQC